MHSNKVELLNRNDNLEGLTYDDSLDMNIMDDLLQILHLTNHNLGIHHLVIKKASNNPLLGSILF